MVKGDKNLEFAHLYMTKGASALKGAKGKKAYKKKSKKSSKKSSKKGKKKSKGSCDEHTGSCHTKKASKKSS